MNIFLLSSYDQHIVDWSFLSNSLSPSLGFSRTSTGARLNASGYIESVGLNLPRLDFSPLYHRSRGILIEPQATNLLSQSIPYTNWYTAPAVLTAGAGIAPDGTNTLVKVEETTASGSHNAFPNTITLTAGAYYTFSVFVKAGTATVVQLAMSLTAFGANCYANFNLSTGEVSYQGAAAITASINNVGNSIYRVSISGIATTSGSYVLAATGLINNNPLAGRSPSYDGTGAFLFLWGAQAETGALPTSYIPTSGTAATRAVDVLTFTIPKGVSKLRYLFDDNTTQDVAVSTGSYTIPTTLNRAWIKRIYSV